MVHLVVHLPKDALYRGPVKYGWMYPIERRLCTFKGTVRNNARVEACIAEACIVAKAFAFCSRYILDRKMRSNLGGRTEEVEKSIFNHGVRLVGKKENRTLMQYEYDQLTW